MDPHVGQQGIGFDLKSQAPDEVHQRPEAPPPLPAEVVGMDMYRNSKFLKLRAKSSPILKGQDLD
jgi:hypothetical protein